MKPSFFIIFCLNVVACNNSNLQTHKPIPKSIHIPDTTNNWYAKLYDYPSYLEKIEITKQLHLDNLEEDTTNSEIRIWFLGSNYNPQQVYLIIEKDSFWTITELTYYLSFNNPNGRMIDSISKRQEKNIKVSAKDFALLDVEKIWQLQSQSEMKKGGSYGCIDGYSMLIEMNTKEKYKYLFYMCPDLHVSKDSTFRTVIEFSNKVDKLLRGAK